MPENTPQPALFGVPRVYGSGPGPLLAAADETIDALRARQLVAPEHALLIALIRQTARAADEGLAHARVSVATTSLVRELHDLMGELPGQVEGGDTFGEAYRAFLESIGAPVPE